jgi:hypothetical protein
VCGTSAALAGVTALAKVGTVGLGDDVLGNAAGVVRLATLGAVAVAAGAGAWHPDSPTASTPTRTTRTRVTRATIGVRTLVSGQLPANRKGGQRTSKIRYVQIDKVALVIHRRTAVSS